MAVQEQEQEKVWFAREVFNLFVKAFTNLKLYPHEHKYCVEALDEFGKRLQAYTKLHDVLRIGVNQETLIVEDQDVYEAENQNENLAFRLYVDGLREIAVNRGVTTEEAHGLAHVFYESIVNQEADCTLLLWEADFRNIDHVAINSLTDAWESPDYFSADQLDVLKQMNRDVDNIVEQLTQNAGRDNFNFELSDTGSEMDSIEDLDVDGKEREEDEDIFDLDDEALNTFKREAMSWGPDRLLLALVGHALDGYSLQAEVIGSANVGWLLKEAVQLALRSRDMELLSELLNRYDGELQLIEDEDEKPFRDVFSWLAREENLERLVNMGAGGGLGGPKAYCRILALLGPTGMIAAVASYLSSDKKELRDALIKYMQEHSKDNPLALKPMLDPDRSVETVKAGMFVVTKTVKGDALAELLDICRQHPDPEIKKYSDHLWRTNTTAGRVNVMLDALRAEKRDDRVRALQFIVKNKAKQAIDILKDCIGKDDFLTRDIHERQAYIEALRYLGGTTVVAFLDNQTKRSTMIFNRKAAKEVRELAKKALADLKSARRQ